jgi:hypothetical protein
VRQIGFASLQAARRVEGLMIPLANSSASEAHLLLGVLKPSYKIAFF